MRIGSRTAFRIEENAIAYIVLFVSPSPRRMAYAMLLKRMKIVPIKRILPYSAARDTTDPAPRSTARGSVKRIRGMVRITATAAPIRSPCIAACSAPCRFFPPILRATTEETPAPSPFPRPMNTMKSGVMNPTAASASAPSPATQMALIRL